MLADANDIAIAQQAFAGEADLLNQLGAQAMTGDANAKVELQAELNNAVQMRALYRAELAGLDTGVIDAAIAEANGTIAGATGTLSLTDTTTAAPATTTPKALAPSGLKLGSVVIPWSGVIAAGVFVGLAFYLSKKPRR